MANSNTSKIGRYLFMGILVVHMLGCYIMGIISLTNAPFAFEIGFQIPYSDQLAIIGVVMGMELLFLGSIAFLGIIWTKQGNRYGITMGMAVGMYMFLFGIVAFLLLGRIDGLLVDSIRGFLTLVFGYMAHKELQNN